MKLKRTTVGIQRLLVAFAWASTANMFAQTTVENTPGNAAQAAQAAQNEQNNIIKLTPFTVVESPDTGYGAMEATTGRLGEAYVDTPQAISIVTSEIIADAYLDSTYTAVKYVPNVEETNSEHVPYFVIRGVGTGDLYVDGFDIGSANTLDSAFFDRIEVVKGPAGAGFGRGNPAGFLNMVSKQPLYQNSSDIDVIFGPGGQEANFKTILDNNGIISTDGKTAYRLVAVYDRGSGTKEGSEFERAGTQLSVERQLPEGQFVVTTNLFHNHNPSVVGGDLSNETTWSKQFYCFYGPGAIPSYTLFPNADFTPIPLGIGMLDQGMITTAALNYNLTKDFSARLAVNYQDIVQDGTWAGPASELWNPVTGYGQAYVFRSYSAVKDWSYQADFAWKHGFDFLKSNYTLLFGGDYSDNYDHSSFQVTNSTPAPLLPWNPVLATYSFPQVAEGIGSIASGIDESAYAQLLASCFDGRISLTVAERENRFNLQGSDYVTGQVTSQNKASTPIFGTYSILVKPLKWLSFYATDAEYENPAILQNLYNGLPATDPRANILITVQPITKLIEFGIKGSLLDDKITFTLAHFKTDTTGNVGYQILPTVVINGVYVHASVGFAETDNISGWEFEAFGRPTKNLEFMIGAGIESGTETVPDATLPQIDTLDQDPGNSLVGRVKYLFNPSSKDGWVVDAGGKVYFSGWSVFTGSTNYYTGNLTYPDTETVFDFGTSYGFGKGKYRVGLDVTNAFHRHASVHTFGGQGTESGRLVFVNVDAKF